MKSFKQKSPMVHQFSNVPKAEIPRSVFSVRSGYKTAFNPDYLIPFYVNEALPGDTFNLHATLFCRLMPLAVPIMDNLFMDTFYFAVPMRLVWDNWQKFCGERVDPDDDIDYSIPQLVAPAVTGFTLASLSDYMGLPIGVPGISVSALWHRAYNLIWNDWFRDQNIQDSVVVDKDDSASDIADYVLLKRGKRHDYFTSCLPWPQKGDAIEMPLGTEAPVLGMAFYPDAFATAPNANRFQTDGIAKSAGNNWMASAGAGDNIEVQGGVVANRPHVFADLSAGTAATINSLREAFQLQRMLERDARGGSRYIEIVRSHFGVISPDARLQRPEFLGGKSTSILITPIAQQSAKSATGTTTPQGYLAGIGTGASIGEGFTKSFTEHTLIIGMLMVRGDLTYQQGIPRMFSRSTRYDFYWPALANLGEQAVLTKEIYAQDPTIDTDSDGIMDNDEVFGYQERWAEYRYFPSKITGVLRSQAASSLDVWHMAQEFVGVPTLSPAFIEEALPISRALAVTAEPAFILDALIENRMVRPMPVYSVPGLIDHF